MALGGCYRCLKCLMVVFNMLYWALGLSILILSIVLLSHGDKYIVIKGGDSEAFSEFFVAVYVLFAIGSFLVILGFLGCCGAIRESPCMLSTFFVLMLCAIVVEVGAGAHIWSQAQPIKDSIQKQLNLVIQEQYYDDNANKSFMETIDSVQRTFHCCGVVQPSDWATTRYNGQSGIQGAIYRVVDAAASSLKAYNVPRSCCVNEQDTAVCDVARNIPAAGQITDQLYTVGCLPALWNGLTFYAQFGGGIVVVAVGFQIIGLILALLLCFAARRDLKD